MNTTNRMLKEEEIELGLIHNSQKVRLFNYFNLNSS